MKIENDKLAYLTFTSSTYVRVAAPFKMIFLTKDIFKPIYFLHLELKNFLVTLANLPWDVFSQAQHCL